MGNALSAHVAACPVGTRLIAALYILVSAGIPALGHFSPAYALRLRLWFICCLATVARKGNYAALFTSLFFRPLPTTVDVATCLVELYMAGGHLRRKEEELGSLRLLAWSALVAGGVNTVFLLLMRALEGNIGLGNQGLWPLVMVNVTLQALELPNMPMKVLGLVDVPSRWYPLSLAVGLSILNSAVQWETLAGIVFGYVYKALDLQRTVLLSPARAKRLERDWLPSLPGLLGALLGGRWVPAPDSGGDQTLGGLRPFGGLRVVDVETGAPAPLWPSSTQGSNSRFELFGGTGRRLGD